MKQKTIGIDINEIIRSHWAAVESFYIKFKGEEAEIKKPFNSYEYLNHFTFPEKVVNAKYLKEKLPDLPVELYHSKEEKDINHVDHLLFNKIKEKLTSLDQLNKFLYEDYVFEVFGSCGKVYSNASTDLISFYKKNKDQYRIKIISLEEYQSIPATLFFLSKCGINIPDYCFYGDPNRVWKEMDICITSNPKILKSKPKNKFCILADREFNIGLKADHHITNLSDLLEVDFKQLTNNNKHLYKFFKKLWT